MRTRTLPFAGAISSPTPSFSSSSSSCSTGVTFSSRASSRASSEASPLASPLASAAETDCSEMSGDSAGELPSLSSVELDAEAAEAEDLLLLFLKRPKRDFFAFLPGVAAPSPTMMLTSRPPDTSPFSPTIGCRAYQSSSPPSAERSFSLESSTSPMKSFLPKSASQHVIEREPKLSFAMVYWMGSKSLQSGLSVFLRTGSFFLDFESFFPSGLMWYTLM
mmetsp:Transcript_8595/g.35825  ORF Transcript_8595/g.35825 Transcript_8595/m.35825 type:complete len:220 (+) Transcript_8595:1191-1850(+)